jgi:hypothetical protein
VLAAAAGSVLRWVVKSKPISICGFQARSKA